MTTTSKPKPTPKRKARGADMAALVAALRAWNDRQATTTPAAIAARRARRVMGVK